MNESIKLSENELAEVRMLQDKFQQKIYQLGRLYLQKMQADQALKSLADEELKLKGEWASLQKMENELIDQLLKKYGEGSLDIPTGTFIPDKSQSPTQ